MNIYKKIIAYAPKKAYLATLSIILSLLSTITLMVPFWYLWKFLYAIIVAKDNSGALTYAFIITGLFIANMVLYFSALICSHILAFNLESNLRKIATNHLLNASFSFFDTHPSGTVRKIIDDNASLTHVTVAHLIPDLVNSIATPILLFTLTFMVDIKLGILLLIVTLISFVLVKIMYGEKQFMAIYMKTLDELNAHTVEYVRGMQVFKIFRTTVNSYKSFYELIKRYADMVLRYSMSCRRGYVFFQILLNSFIVFTIPFAIVFINHGADSNLILTKVIFFAAIATLLFLAFMRIMWVGQHQFQASSVITNLEEIFKEMEVKKLVHGTETKFDNYNITFKNVTFKYDSAPVLSKFNLNFEQGKFYAITGPSGGGKSTIAKLLSGFYSVDDGEILIGDKNINCYTQEAITNNISFLFQNTKLFPISIYENVKLAKPTATKEEILKALYDAQCDDILEKFPDKENTIIGAKGVYLSGGEVQRIAIARIILKDSKIVVLDEASASADPENEYQIQKAFTNLMKNKTVIMIAHRLSTITNCDEILVIAQGKVVERGSHETLLKKGGHYFKLQELYTKAHEWRIA